MRVVARQRGRQSHPALVELQSGEPSTTALLQPARCRGARPARHARSVTPGRPGWRRSAPRRDGDGGDTGGGRHRRRPRRARQRRPCAPQREGGDEPGRRRSTQLPLWIQAAVRLGARFVRVAAAGMPPAAALFTPCRPRQNGCCAECGAWHEPARRRVLLLAALTPRHTRQVDAGRRRRASPTATRPPTGTVPEKLPGAAALGPGTGRAPVLVPRAQRRVPASRAEAPRRCVIDPTALPAGGQPELDFKGRTGDSLRFEVSGGIAPTGYLDPTPPRIPVRPRDRLRRRAAACRATGPPAGAIPGGLAAYPFFAYVCPGAPVGPLSLFMVALTVAGTLRAHCRFEAALKWYELVVRPADPGRHLGSVRDAVPAPGLSQKRPSARVSTSPRARDAAGGTSPCQGGGDLPCCPTQAPDDDVAGTGPYCCSTWRPCCSGATRCCAATRPRRSGRPTSSSTRSRWSWATVRDGARPGRPRRPGDRGHLRSPGRRR